MSDLKNVGYADRGSTFVGKTITDIEADKEREQLRFFCSDGTVISCVAEGDCCSHSWFHHAEVSALIGATVTECEWLGDGENSKDPADGSECERVYWIRFKTDKGHATIELRNESNGYYGGWVEVWVGEGDPKTSKNIFDDAGWLKTTPVTEDW